MEEHPRRKLLQLLQLLSRKYTAPGLFVPMPLGMLAVLDTNVARILGAPLACREEGEAALRYLVGGRASSPSAEAVGEWNLTLLDFGAVCTAKKSAVLNVRCGSNVRT